MGGHIAQRIDRLLPSKSQRMRQTTPRLCRRRAKTLSRGGIERSTFMEAGQLTGEASEQVTEQVTEQASRLLESLRDRPLSNQEILERLGLFHCPTLPL